jgi:hypothetical protein
MGRYYEGLPSSYRHPFTVLKLLNSPFPIVLQGWMNQMKNPKRPGGVKTSLNAFEEDKTTDETDDSFLAPTEKKVHMYI